MTNICNRFKALDQQTGNFILFSQYVDDISKSTIDSNYRVSPNKFICLDVDSTMINQAGTLVPEGGFDDNEKLPGFFQNSFENGCSLLRNQNNNYIDSQKTSVNFWYNFLKLIDFGFVGNDKQFSQVKYVGNIDLSSWESGFADIILDINSGAHPTKVTVDSDISQLTASSFNTTAYNNTEIDETYYVSGWGEDDPEGAVNTVVGSTTTASAALDNISIEGGSIFETLFTHSTDEQSTNPFTFNTIIILYDVFDGENHAIYKDVPMGVYFTGEVKTENGEPVIMNPVTIYPSNTNAYGAGSGWSLRICTRFSPLPYGLMRLEEVTLESGVIGESLSALMSSMAETIKTLNSFADESIYNSQTIKDLYALFKNGRTNVPYIKSVNGVDYWFVNGRNTEVLVYQN